MGLAPANLVNDEEKRDCSEDELHDTVYIRREQRRIGARNTNRLEDLRGVVADGVRAGELLPHHECEDEQESVPHTRLEALLPSQLARCFGVDATSHGDLVELADNVGVIGRLITHVS